MPNIEFNIKQIDPIGFESFNSDDVKVVESFDINTRFNIIEHKIELHSYTNDGSLVGSIYDHRNVRFLQGSETAGNTGASIITLEPEADAKNLGYSYGGVNFVYNFLDNLFTDTSQGGEFFIEEISEDRTEIRLLTNQLKDEEVILRVNKIKEDLESTSYFNEFRINLKNNDLFIATNIDIQNYRDYNSVIVKLYEPLPPNYGTKELLTIERVISAPTAFSIDTLVIPDKINVPKLKGPNFNVDTLEEQNSPTGLLSYNDLFSFPTNNTYREVTSRLAEKGIDISIDYSNFSNFVQFSSAEERLRNFQYKLNLITRHQVEADKITNMSTGSIYLTGSADYYKNQIVSILDNFDHYDRHLYFESSSTSWPKTNNTKPFINAIAASTSSFISDNLLSASNFDVTNTSQLLNSIPEYLKEDPDSVKYSTFINMLAQHFDNIWVYAKALSDKYDNDNRLEYGISKDLVQDTLRNFGVKIYNNFRSTDDLFKVFTGEIFSTGSDLTDSFVTASATIPSLEDYKKDISKRIYHNLPYLLKTKGTERGLKALIASFGVPTNNNLSHISSSDKSSFPGLYIRTIGGNFTSGSQNFGPSYAFTSSLGKVKVYNTGSITDGSTLSGFTSVVQRGREFSDDSHTIEVGFSPTYELDSRIESFSSPNFNIDDYIGDPGTAYSSSYIQLASSSNALFSSSLNSNITSASISSSFAYSVIGDGFRVANVSGKPSSYNSYQTVIQLSGSQGPTSSNYIYHSTRLNNSIDPDAPDENRYLIKSGGGMTRVTTNVNLSGGSYSEGSVGVGAKAMTGSNIIDLHPDSGSMAGARGYLLGGNIYLKQDLTGSHNSAIDGAVVNRIYQYGRWYPPNRQSAYALTVYDSASSVKALEVSGGPYTYPEGTEFQVVVKSLLYNTEEMPDQDVYPQSGSSTGVTWYAYSQSLVNSVKQTFLPRPLKSHNYGEFVRSLMFYDNVLFKMIKDFVPARANVNTGVIIKPHILERSKIKQIRVGGDQKPSNANSSIQNQFVGNLMLTSSINMKETSGSSGGSFLDVEGIEIPSPLTASYTVLEHETPFGVAQMHYHEKERPRYDGELSGSFIKILPSDGDLNDGNEWKVKNIETVSYKSDLVNLAACPTINIINFVGIDNVFHLTGSIQAAPGSYNVGFDYYQGSTSTFINAFQIAPSVVITGSGELRLFSASATNNFAAGYWNAKASVDSVDCGLEFSTAITTSAVITEVCPAVETVQLLSSGSYGMTFFGSTIGTGTNGIVERGFVYSTTNQLPSVTGSDSYKVTDGVTNSGSLNTLEGWTKNQAGLSEGTTYYVRAYVSGSATCGVKYGSVLSELTDQAPAVSEVGSFTVDRYMHHQYPQQTAISNKQNACNNNAIKEFSVELFFRKLRPDQVYPFSSVSGSTLTYGITGQKVYFDESLHPAFEATGTQDIYAPYRNYFSGSTQFIPGRGNVTVPSQPGVGNKIAEILTDYTGMTGSISIEPGTDGLIGPKMFMRFNANGKTVNYSDCNNRVYQPGISNARSHRNGHGII